MVTLDTQEYLDTALALLEDGRGPVRVPITGNSMCPFLYPGDTAFLSLPEKPLKTGDVVLFTRPGGRYILHRIVGCHPDGYWLIRGDNQSLSEPVPPQAVRAVMHAAQRKGRMIREGTAVWWFFAHPWRFWAGLRQPRK